jgi:hypothetical protein
MICRADGDGSVERVIGTLRDGAALLASTGTLRDGVFLASTGTLREDTAGAICWCLVVSGVQMPVKSSTRSNNILVWVLVRSARGVWGVGDAGHVQCRANCS